MTTDQILNHALQFVAALAPILWQIWVRRQDKRPADSPTTLSSHGFAFFARYGLLIVISPALGSLAWTLSETTPMTRLTVFSVAFDFAMIVIAFVLNEQSRRIMQNMALLHCLEIQSEAIRALGEQHLELVRSVTTFVDVKAIAAKPKRRKPK